MNTSTSIMLINEKIRAVLVQFEKDTPGTKAKREMFKTLNQDLKAGDLVVVPTQKEHRHGFTVSLVSDVDVDVDFDSPVEVNWIAGVFNPAEYDNLVSEEIKYSAIIRKGEQLKRRRDIAGNLEALKVEGLQSLAIAGPEAKAIADSTVPGGGSQGTSASTAA